MHRSEQNCPSEDSSSLYAFLPESLRTPLASIEECLSQECEVQNELIDAYEQQKRLGKHIRSLHRNDMEVAVKKEQLIQALKQSVQQASWKAQSPAEELRAHFTPMQMVLLMMERGVCHRSQVQVC